MCSDSEECNKLRDMLVDLADARHELCRTMDEIRLAERKGKDITALAAEAADIRGVMASCNARIFYEAVRLRAIRLAAEKAVA